MSEEVLVVEDDETRRDLVESALSRRYRVETAADGQVAWEYLTGRSSDPPDAVVLDVMLPEIDGFTLLDRIRSDPDLEAVPVIITSGRAREEDVQRGLEAGATDYVIKPHLPADLAERIEQAMSDREVTSPPR